MRGHWTAEMSPLIVTLFLREALPLWQIRVTGSEVDAVWSLSPVTLVFLFGFSLFASFMQ